MFVRPSRRTFPTHNGDERVEPSEWMNGNTETETQTDRRTDGRVEGRTDGLADERKYGHKTSLKEILDAALNRMNDVRVLLGE